MTGAILVVVLMALILRLPMMLAGGLVGLGGTWLILLGRQALLCAQPGQLCGGTPPDMIPWLVIVSAIAIAGLAAGAITVARKRA